MELIKLQPKTVIQNMLQYNIFFILLEQINWPLVRDLYNMLFNIQYPDYQLDEEYMELIWRYAKITEFFLDLGNKL
jgi:hypothetical protein